MTSVLLRSVRASLFDRRPHGEALYESSATADAALLVAAVSGASFLIAAVRAGTRNPVDLVLGLIPAAIFGLAGWLFLAVATWFAGSRLFRGSGDAQMVMRVHGLAYLPNLAGALGGAAAAVGSLWSLAAAAVGTAVAMSLTTRDGALSVLIGAAALFVFGLIFRLPFLALGSIFS
jgi:hypothetical protein